MKQMYVHLTVNPTVSIDTIYILLLYCIHAHTSTVTMFIIEYLRKLPGGHDIYKSCTAMLVGGTKEIDRFNTFSIV